jgi:hypothetical protein
VGGAAGPFGQTEIDARSSQIGSRTRKSELLWPRRGGRRYFFPPTGRPARRFVPSLPGPASHRALTTKGVSSMGKGNHSQKNDKKNKKPKQDKTKTVVKK